MKVISEFVVHVFDLIEAEGRSLLTVVRGEARHVRHTATDIAVGVTFLLVAVPLLIAGAGLLAAGLMWWLETLVGRPLAAGLTGLAVLGAAGACLSCFKWLAAREHP